MTLTQLRDGFKAWWPVACIVGGLIVLWGNVPPRLAAAEQKNAAQDEQLKSLAEIQAYWKGVYEAQQQPPPQAQRPQPAPPAPATTPRVWQEQDRNGDWYCIDETGAWWWPDRDGRC